MKKVYCPHCNHTLTPCEGYKVLNFKKLSCPNCKSELVPKWHASVKPLWQRRLLVLAWSFPAIVALSVVWFEPQWWLYLAGALTLFHVIALAYICIGGYYSVQLKD
ncbi:hypothetical protein GW756_01150 [bacterium]|nr:hypothetical protein [bacterium]NCQ54963.1 hypothetical protein [Candidatus Parcubacteria bacterium]NCS67007.1 hypothetical protein [Candidatus Peregrinibacteria bacterium]NCS95953.1 hypothetical protein [bacterium]